MPKVPRRPDLEHLRKFAAETTMIPRGTELWRVYFRGGRHPTRWNEFRHVGPLDARFDHHEGDEPRNQPRSAFYAAHNPVTCLAEVFQKTRTIDRSERDGWIVGFPVAEDIEVLNLMGSFATKTGASMGLMTGARSVSRNWARGFYGVYPNLLGIQYPSSMHANAPALVLNDRAERIDAIAHQPSFHRALADPAILTILKNAARELGHALG